MNKLPPPLGSNVSECSWTSFHWSWTPPMAPYHTIAQYNGTQHWHHVHCTLQWHQSAKVVRRPPPPIGSANPYSYRYLGKNRFPTPTQLRLTPHRRLHLLQGVSPASGTLKGKAWWCIDGAPGCWMTYMDDPPAPALRLGSLPSPDFLTANSPVEVGIRWKIPVFTGFIYKSQVVGLGISEPSTVAPEAVEGLESYQRWKVRPIFPCELFVSLRDVKCHP